MHWCTIQYLLKKRRNYVWLILLWAPWNLTSKEGKRHYHYFQYFVFFINITTCRYFTHKTSSEQEHLIHIAANFPFSVSRANHKSRIWITKAHYKYIPRIIDQSLESQLVLLRRGRDFRRFYYQVNDIEPKRDNIANFIELGRCASSSLDFSY